MARTILTGTGRHRLVHAAPITCDWNRVRE